MYNLNHSIANSDITSLHNLAHFLAFSCVPRVSCILSGCHRVFTKGNQATDFTTCVKMGILTKFLSMGRIPFA